MRSNRVISLAVGVLLGLAWSAAGNPLPRPKPNPVAGRAALEKYPAHADRIQQKADALGLRLDYDQRPRLMKGTYGRYPQDAFVHKKEGMVLVMFVIDDTGKVAEAEALESAAGFDEAALEAVKTWEFRPARKDREPVGAIAVVEMRFEIY